MDDISRRQRNRPNADYFSETRSFYCMYTTARACYSRVALQYDRGVSEQTEHDREAYSTYSSLVLAALSWQKLYVRKTRVWILGTLNGENG